MYILIRWKKFRRENKIRNIITFLIIFQYQPSDFDLRDDNHGVMVRTFNNLFDKIRALNNEEEFCKIKASYLEIYNEKTIDLLNHGSKRMNLPLRWNKQNQAFNVENLFVFSCTETQDLVNILLEGTKNRALGSHRYVFHIHKKIWFTGPGGSRVLGGSEWGWLFRSSRRLMLLACH